MIPTVRAMRTALPASGSVDNAFLIATVPMPASPITSAAMRAALPEMARAPASAVGGAAGATAARSEEHTSELQSHSDLVCRLLLEKKKTANKRLRWRDAISLVVARCSRRV